MKQKKLQKKLYQKLVTLLYNAHSGHIGSCLSCLDILIQVFFFELKKDDKFILSKGHAAPALYAVMHELGHISDDDFKTFHLDGTRLPAHTPNDYKDVIPFPTGSLGHGLSLACGIAHSLRLQNQRIKQLPRMFVLMSDGECNEGQLWEAVQYAVAKKLSNIIGIVDKNNIQALGRTKDVLGESAAAEKWQAFGFETYTANGHDLDDLDSVFGKIDKSTSDKPKVIVCETIKGHGISFMENTVASHYNPLTEEQYRQAMADITLRYA